jgi:hypothetical protein
MIQLSVVSIRAFWRNNINLYKRFENDNVFLFSKKSWEFLKDNAVKLKRNGLVVNAGWGGSSTKCSKKWPQLFSGRVR